MGAKRIKKRRFAPDIARVNRALRAIVANTSSATRPGVAPMPIWELTGPLPGPEDADSPLPAIRPELVDPVIVITDPHVVMDFEGTGTRIARMLDPDQEKVLLWLIDKSRHLDGRNIDSEFAIDMGPEIKSRMMGATLATLAEKGRARIIATGDESKVVVQMIYGPDDYAQDRAEVEAQYRRLFPHRTQ